MAVCLVTGGAGFIGSYLTEALLAAGHRVRVLDNLSTGDLANLEQMRGRIDLIQRDLTDLDAVMEATRGVDWVFHQAALASVPRSVADPMATHRACVDGTLHVLLAARDAKVKRVVYAGSSSAYGNSDRLPKRESDPTAPLSPYAVAKLAGEHYCAAFHEVYGLETVTLRYFNVFGPRQTPDSPYAAVIPLFIRALLAGKGPLIHGDGMQSRDFTYIDNVVQANLLAATAPKVGGKVYNVACGGRFTLLDIVAGLNRILGTHIAPVHTDSRPGDVRHSQADISRARADLSYSPTIDLEEGLRRCVKHHRAALEKKSKVHA
jgi:UDP-glucose 4-epimerase